tara:strand:- start:742 stop:846 length:105 start_codon:yes stop_codon:yes gene_type:complete
MALQIIYNEIQELKNDIDDIKISLQELVKELADE